jgi:hypothetical protein
LRVAVEIPFTIAAAADVTVDWIVVEASVVALGATAEFAARGRIVSGLANVVARLARAKAKVMILFSDMVGSKRL